MKGDVIMKKAVKIIAVAFSVIFILITLYNTIIGEIIFVMPSEMKKESVCFLAPELTWNSTNSAVKDCFGEPVEKGEYNDVTGDVTDTYILQYENRPMTVYTTRKALLITQLLCKHRVHRYRFVIECADEEDAKLVFEEICNGQLGSKSLSESFCESRNEVSSEKAYGPCWINCHIRYDINDGKGTVILDVDATY